MNECALGLLVDIGQSRPAVVFRCRPVQQRVMVLAHRVAVARVALREGEQRAVRHDEPGDPKIVLFVQRRVRLWVDPPRCPLTLREDVRTAEHRRLELAAARGHVVRAGSAESGMSDATAPSRNSCTAGSCLGDIRDREAAEGPRRPPITAAFIRLTSLGVEPEPSRKSARCFAPQKK